MNQNNIYNETWRRVVGRVWAGPAPRPRDHCYGQDIWKKYWIYLGFGLYWNTKLREKEVLNEMRRQNPRG